MKKKSYLIILAILIIAIITLSLLNIIDEQIGMSIALGLIIIFVFLVGIEAYKHDIKIVLLLMIIFMIGGCVLLGYNIFSIVTQEKEDILYLTVKENSSDKTKVFTYQDNSYYTYNLSEVSVHLNDTTYTLEDALTKNIIALDDILSLGISSKDTIGYKVYYDGGLDEYESDAYSIVICDNKDIIFTKYSYNYNDTICS